MKTAVFFVLDENVDWEGPYLSSRLNQNSEWTVKTAATNSEIVSTGGFKTKVDYTIEDLPKDCDLLVLIGGKFDPALSEIIDLRIKKQQPFAAIGEVVDYLVSNHQVSERLLTDELYAESNLVAAKTALGNEFADAVLKMVDFTSDKTVKALAEFYDNGYFEYCQKYGITV
ncbi:DJ-1/PfpI family protein [Companilactobacillus sp. HBUAS59544]|uniref:DJ-1/PfpI family protein n=1 Tax=Companilactobacillus sp. HBUAS59544 TaxID=3109363 RepID=UPI002FF05756